MLQPNMTRVTASKPRCVLFCFAAALVFAGCAALQPPSATGPRGAEQLYPVLLTEDPTAKEATLAALSRLTQAGNAAGLETKLQPVTATVLGLPATPSNPLYLPKVGATAVMSEEETRESLRRFIRDWQELIGSDPAKLSLVERTEQPDGSKLATYEQRPFRNPIRGGYGKLQIRFASDRRVIDLSSSCIPDADRIQNTLSGLTVQLTAEDAVKRLRGNEISYTDPAGNTVKTTLSSTSEITPLELVTYIRPAKNQVSALEFHIAWELQAGSLPPRRFYVDAISGDVLGAE